jgi:hypothetical protein
MAAAIQKAAWPTASPGRTGRGLERCLHASRTASLTAYLKALPKLIDRIEACLDSIVPFQRLMRRIEEDEAYVQSHLGALAS